MQHSANISMLCQLGRIEGIYQCLTKFNFLLKQQAAASHESISDLQSHMREERERAMEAQVSDCASGSKPDSIDWGEKFCSCFWQPYPSSSLILLSSPGCSSNRYAQRARAQWGALCALSNDMSGTEGQGLCLPKLICYPTPYTLLPPPYTPYLIPSTPHPLPRILQHLTPYTLHETIATLRSTLDTRYPSPSTLHPPTPYTLNPL